MSLALFGSYSSSGTKLARSSGAFLDVVGQIELSEMYVDICCNRSSQLRRAEIVQAGYTDKPTHVLLVADPQVLDHRSYPGRSSWLMILTQFVVDLNIRKSWTVATRFRPNVVVFLGDMMDNGRYASGDAE